MKTLIGITTCGWRKAYADSQRATWVKDSLIDVEFFVGSEVVEDSISLPCSDDYKSLPHKVQEMCRWALHKDYDFVFKVDDDVYVRPERVNLAVGDYVGLYREPYWECPSGYCSGFGYCLSKKSLEVIANADSPKMEAEDRWIANELSKVGVYAKHDNRFILTIDNKSPAVFNDLIMSAEYKDMRVPHNVWLQSLADLNNITNQIKL
jgi:hypothetical protein